MTTTDTPATDARDDLADLLNANLFDRGQRVEDWPADEAALNRDYSGVWTDGMDRQRQVRAMRFRKAADAVLDAGWRPPTTVIPADTRPYETQAAALDALPVHTLVSYRDHDGELHTLEKTAHLTRRGGDSVWWETTARMATGTYNLVRNEVDYTIVRMGDGS